METLFSKAAANGSRSNLPAPADKPEDAFRGFLNAIFPGGERALDLLQDLSSTGKGRGE